MTQFIINSIADIQKLNRKLKSLKSTLSTIRKFALEKAADEAVLTSIHRDMEAAGISKKIIETTYVGETEIINNGKKIIVHFISDYVPDNGFDVGDAREEGTNDHMIRPLPGNKTGRLWWVDPKTGKLLSSKGHMVSGLPRLLIIEKNINTNKQKFQNAYENEISSQLNQVLK